jgi:hypothetical protein
MTESTVTAIIAAVGTIMSTVLAVVLPRLIGKIRKSTLPESRPPRRLGFFQILSLGLSITAILVAIITQRQLASLQKAFPPASGKLEVSRKDSGSSDDGTITLTVPPGTYMTGITFGINKGSSHGIVNNVTPLYKPFLPPSDEKQR